MKRLAAAMIAFIPFFLEAQQQITVGVFLHPPYVERATQTGEVYGAGIEYMNAILAEMGYSARFVLQPFSRVIASVMHGDVDASFELIKTPERQTFAYFPDIPAVRLTHVLIVNADSKLLQIQTVDDLKGLTIGYIHGSTIPDFLKVENVFEFENISGEDWVKQNLLKLRSRRIDAVLDLNPHSFLVEAKRLKISDKVRIIPLPVEPTDFYVVFSKKSPQGLELLVAYNKISKEKSIDYYEIINTELR